MHLKEGFKLLHGKYHLLNQIGDGGFSLTYKGSWITDVRGPLGSVATVIPVCIKEYFFKDYCMRNEDSPDVITNSVTGKEIFEKHKERLVKEANILSGIRHPYVVKVLEVFKENNTVYIVMEYLSGQSLKQWLIEKGVFDEKELITLIYKIGQALQFIHEKNILHLDIKPSNILIKENQQPILIDFGISKQYDSSNQQETNTIIQAVSKGYASIEQYDSDSMKSFSPCPDIYALGATMYHLLTGQVPTESILRSTKGLTPPREINPLLSEKTEKVILKAMALLPEDRYVSVMDMMIDLGFDPTKDQVDLSEDTEENPVIYKPIQPTDPEDEKTELRPHWKKNNTITTSIFRKKKTYIFITLFFLLAFVSFALGYKSSFFEKKKVLTAAISFQPALEDDFDPLAQSVNNHEKNSNDHNSTQPIDHPHDQIIDQPNNQPNDQPVDQPSDQTTNQPNYQPIDTENKPMMSTSEAAEEILNLALSLLHEKKYDEALIQLKEVQKMDITKNVNDYIVQCNQKIQEKEEWKKKSEHFKRIWYLGKYLVVKDLSTNLYGAIDEESQEIKIIFKYISVWPAGTNTAFKTKEGLYDIYSPDGALIESSKETYDYK